MKRVSVVFLFAASFVGCANTHPPAVPLPEGKPRVQINKAVPPEAAPVIQREGE